MMSFRTITLASIYELQGFEREALEIYEDILKKDPNNQEAKDAYKRLSKVSKTFKNVNTQAKHFFLKAHSDEELKTFERWLMQWN